MCIDFKCIFFAAAFIFKKKNHNNDLSQFDEYCENCGELLEDCECDEQNFSKEDISQEEYLKIKECAVDYIKVDCTSLAKRTSTSLREIDNILYNTRTYPNYQWVSAPAFDDYFMKKNK